MEIRRPETLAAHTEIPNPRHKNGIGHFQLQNSTQHPYFYFALTLTPCHYITILVLYVLRASCENSVSLAFQCLLVMGARAIISMTITRKSMKDPHFLSCRTHKHSDLSKGLLFLLQKHQYKNKPDPNVWGKSMKLRRTLGVNCLLLCRERGRDDRTTLPSAI
jgi:hypothetical protein